MSLISVPICPIMWGVYQEILLIFVINLHISENFDFLELFLPVGDCCPLLNIQVFDFGGNAIVPRGQNVFIILPLD